MNKIKKLLDKLYPNPKCELNYRTDFEFLIAVVLSAQCTDKKVNAVTEKLFEKYNTPADFAKLSQAELEKEIFSIGLYKNKSKNIIKLSQQIISDFNGKIPNTFEGLMELAGVGRKTANVVLSGVLGVPAFAVDTHVFRVSHRLGISNSKSFLVCEKMLKKFFPKSQWSKTHYQMVLFGRYTCKARNPACKDCVFEKICKHKGVKNVSRQSKNKN